MRSLPLRLRSWLSALAMVCACSLAAQTTKVSGVVTDAVTGETVPFVNVGFADTRVSTTTDFDGAFTLESYYATDSIRVTGTGYKTFTAPIKKDVAQTVAVKLEPSTGELQEVVVTYTENSAYAILRQVTRNKPVNNRAKLAAYEYESYNKVEFDLNNITEDFRKKKLFREFAFIFDQVDTTGGKPYLPIFMTETLSDVYYRQEPKARREHIKGNRVSGIENESVTQFMGDMYQNVNIYENFLIVFGKNFVSPIADGGKQHYDYLLVDSNWVDHSWCYLIRFKPKHAQQLCFEGEMWINDTSFAVRRIDIGIMPGTNLNFVQDLQVHQEYDQVQPEVYMLTKDQMLVDLNILNDSTQGDRKKLQGFYGRRTASYKDFVINQPRDPAFYDQNVEVIVDKDPRSDSEAFWLEHRHVELSKQEAAVYHMVDTMKTIPKFRTYVDIVNAIVTGYYNIGNFGIGPYFNLYSFNPVEGHRFRVGFLTSDKFSKRVEYEGFVAYGTDDQEFKYGLGGRGFITKDPRQLLGIYYKHDIEQLGQSINAFRQDNLFSSAFRRTPNVKLTMVEEYKVSYEREWYPGLSNTLLLRYRQLAPRGDLAYLRFSDPEDVFVGVPDIRTAEVALNTRFAFREKYVSGTFRRVALAARYPALELHTAFGIPRLLDSGYEYQKVVLRISQRVPVGVLGNLRYNVEGGRIFGTLPYPLLIIHPGNETFYFDESGYNTMNFFEFLSDRYASLGLENHFDGFFFNRIPLFRKLKWREVLGFKALIGDLEAKHNNEMLLLPTMNKLYNGPYMEAGAGIENIFKILRIDGVWRLSYRDHPNAGLFALRMKMSLRF